MVGLFSHWEAVSPFPFDTLQIQGVSALKLSVAENLSVCWNHSRLYFLWGICSRHWLFKEKNGLCIFFTLICSSFYITPLNPALLSVSLWYVIVCVGVVFVLCIYVQGFWFSLESILVRNRSASFLWGGYTISQCNLLISLTFLVFFLNIASFIFPILQRRKELRNTEQLELRPWANAWKRGWDPQPISLHGPFTSPFTDLVRVGGDYFEFTRQLCPHLSLSFF